MSLFFLQLKGELRKLFARKRTYIGFGAFIALEVLILILFQIPKVQRNYRQMIESRGYGFDDYFSGLTLGMIMVMATFLLTMLYLALVGGDVVAKEVEEGTMRMTLCRPISRARLLMVKYSACVIYTFALIGFIGVSGLLMGIIKEGTGGIFVMALEQRFVALYAGPEAYYRYPGALCLYTFSFLTITTVSFTFSCFNMKPAAATIVSLSYFVIDFIFYHLPYFEVIKDWFITRNMSTWINIFQPRIPWETLVEDYAYLFAIDATLVIVAILAFQRRDFKS